MSIVSKMLWCAVCYRWMAHLALIVVYLEFAWNYVHFNSNDYYFMRFTHLRKSPNYANKSLNYFAVGDTWITVWTYFRYSTFWDSFGIFLVNLMELSLLKIGYPSGIFVPGTELLQSPFRTEFRMGSRSRWYRRSLRRHRWFLRSYRRSLRHCRDPWGYRRPPMRRRRSLCDSLNIIKYC